MVGKYSELNENGENNFYDRKNEIPTKILAKKGPESRIPPDFSTKLIIKAILDLTFYQCLQLTTVIGCKSFLEVIGAWALYVCTLLHEILLPPAVNAIKNHAFFRCLQLMTVNDGEGLEEIGEYACIHYITF
jgi:hypothetical protein